MSQQSQAHYFRVPPADQFGTSQAAAWIEALELWLNKLGIGPDAGRTGNDVVHWGDHVLITPRGLELHPEDILIGQGENLRHATMSEVAELNRAEPVEYELVFVSLDQMMRTVVITATEVSTDEHYLIFSNENGVVLALPHAQVVEFNTVKAHEGNVTSISGVEAPIGESSGGNPYSL